MQHVKDTAFLKMIGERIRRLRKEKKLSMMEFAILINNHTEQVGRIERGESNVTIGTLQKVAKGLDISVAQLVRDEL